MPTLLAGRRVVDWDQLEAIYHDILYRQMRWVEGDEGAVLVTEPLFTSKVGLSVQVDCSRPEL